MQKHVQTYNNYPVYSNSGYLLKAGILGTIIGGSAALGMNLHKVKNDEMTMEQAVTNSLAKGAGAGVATAVGAAAASAVSGGVMSAVVMAGAASSVIYLLNSVGSSSSEKVKIASKQTKQEKAKNV